MGYVLLGAAIYSAICAVASPGYFGALTGVFAWFAAKAWQENRDGR